MAIIPQKKRRKVVNLLGYVENKIHEINNDLRIEEEDDVNYTTTYKNGRDSSAKSKLKDLFQALLWLKNDLGVTATITAFTNAQIKALDLDIIEFEDST